MQLYYEALQQFTEYSPQKMLENKYKFYSFLINSDLSEKWLAKCDTHQIFNRLFAQIDGDDYWELPLMLIVSKSLPLIDAYSTYLRTGCISDPFIKRNAFLMANTRNTHFLESLVTENGVQSLIEPYCLRDVKGLVQLAVLISNKSTRADFNFYHQVWRQFERINLENLNESQQIFYYEFARVLALHHFVRTNRRHEHLSDSIALKVLCSKYNILDFFVKFNDGSMITNTNDYRWVRRQLVENGIFNGAVNPYIPNDADRPSEVHIYDQFYMINIMVDALVIKPITRNYDEIMHDKGAEIKQIIDQIDDPLAYIESIQYLFLLLFLRWEHIHKRCFSNSKIEQSASATTSATFSDSTYESDSDDMSVKGIFKTGFVCTFTALKLMLNALSSSMANRKIDMHRYGLVRRFTDISNAIADAQWRLHLVDLYYTATYAFRATSDLKIMLTPRSMKFHEDVSSSSDDGENVGASTSKQHTAIRRKPRRPRKMDQNRKNYINTHSNAADGKAKSSVDSEAASAARDDTQRDRRKCFMSKMLGQLTDMVSIAVIRGDLNLAKSIIQVNSLGVF